MSPAESSLEFVQDGEARCSWSTSRSVEGVKRIVGMSVKGCGLVRTVLIGGGKKELELELKVSGLIAVAIAWCR